MKLIGLMPVRNEAWCLGLTARAALLWCDMFVILLHASTDSSDDIAHQIRQEFPQRVVVLVDDNPVWDEMNQRQDMLHAARVMRASHIAIVDADEILTANLLPGAERGTLPHSDWQHDPIRQATRQLPANRILQLPGYNLRHGAGQYHANGIWGNRWFSTAFRDDPALNWAGDRFHHREPSGAILEGYRPLKQGEGGVMHLWGCSERRLRAKHAWYKITERLRWPDKPASEIDRMYSWAIHGRPEAGDTPERWSFKQVPESWWSPYAHLLGYLQIDAEPWQEAECRRLVKQHGREMFSGLDLFGVS